MNLRKKLSRTLQRIIKDYENDVSKKVKLDNPVKVDGNEVDMIELNDTKVRTLDALNAIDKLAKLEGLYDEGDDSVEITINI